MAKKTRQDPKEKNELLEIYDYLNLKSFVFGIVRFFSLSDRLKAIKRHWKLKRKFWTLKQKIDDMKKKNSEQEII